MYITKIQSKIKGCPFCGNDVWLDDISETVTEMTVNLHCSHCNYSAIFKVPYLLIEDAKKEHSTTQKSFEGIWNNRVESKVTINE